MSRIIRAGLLSLASLLALLALPAVAGEKIWQLHIEGTPDSGGTLVLALAADAGKSRQVPISIRAGFPVARHSRVIAQALLRAVGDTYRIERPEADRIRFRRIDGAVFDLTIVSNTAPSLKASVSPQ